MCRVYNVRRDPVKVRSLLRSLARNTATRGYITALGADENSLINDLNFTGFLFDSLVTRELRVYTQANDAKVYHYRDSSG